MMSPTSLAFNAPSSITPVLATVKSGVLYTVSNAVSLESIASKLPPLTDVMPME